MSLNTSFCWPESLLELGTWIFGRGWQPTSSSDSCLCPHNSPGVTGNHTTMLNLFCPCRNQVLMVTQHVLLTSGPHLQPPCPFSIWQVLTLVLTLAFHYPPSRAIELEVHIAMPVSLLPVDILRKSIYTHMCVHIHGYTHTFFILKSVTAIS